MRRIIVLGFLGVMVLAGAAFLFVANRGEAAVTQDEAMEYVSQITRAAQSSDGSVLCELSLFPNACARDYEELKDLLPETPPTVVCTWELEGSGGTRVAVLQGETAEGDPYVNHMAVARDQGELRGNAIYWRNFGTLVDGGAVSTTDPAMPEAVCK